MHYKVPGRNGGNGEAAVLNWKDPLFVKQFGALAEWLGICCLPGGETRKTGTVLLFMEAGMIKACLHDREAGLRAFVSHASMAGLLDAIEGGLRTGQLEWRVDRGGGKAGK